MENLSTIYHSNWVEAKWNISGFFAHDNIIEDFIVMCETLSNENVPIQSVHGSPALAWNSGRIGGQLDNFEYIINHMTSFNSKNIAVYPTFSKHNITEKDLDDQACNQILNLLNQNKNNGVIISSSLLYDYIKRNFPKLKITASIVKISTENGKGNIDYYEKLSKYFDKIVIHPDDNFNVDLLKNLQNKDKFEIIVNENCLINCPRRSEHYTLLGNNSANLGNAFSAKNCQLFEEFKCRSIPMTKQIFQNKNKTRNCNLTFDELKGIYDMGFRQFKLQGRNDSPHSFIYDLSRYILEPDFMGPLICKSL